MEPTGSDVVWHMRTPIHCDPRLRWAFERHSEGYYDQADHFVRKEVEEMAQHFDNVGKRHALDEGALLRRMMARFRKFDECVETIAEWIKAGYLCKEQRPYATYYWIPTRHDLRRTL